MKTDRALGLDALRGFAILTMFLSGLIPFGVLPDWMYHAQVPPPSIYSIQIFRELHGLI